MNLNVITKMEIEYADSIYFTSSVKESVNRFIYNLACQCNSDNIGYIEYDADCCDDANNINISKRIWMRMLDRLAQLNTNDSCIKNEDEEYTAGELYTIFRDIYKQSSKNNSDTIQLEWF